MNREQMQLRIATAMAKAAQREPGPINVYANTPAIKAPPRFTGRRTFAGTITGDELRITRGAHEVTVDTNGEMLRSAFDAKRIPIVNIGDRFIASAKDVAVNLLCVVELVSIVSESWTAIKATVKAVRSDLLLGSVWLQAVKL